MLYVSGEITQKGSVENKNTVSDFMDEEKSKQGSLSTSLIPVEWNGFKLNFLDVPGTEEFDNEFKQSLAVVKGAVLVLDANRGVEVGAERVWQLLKQKHIPTIIFINKMDKENVKFDEVLKDIETELGKQALPFLLQLGKTLTLKAMLMRSQ